jgi:single-strand DNA-binding protein
MLLGNVTRNPEVRYIPGKDLPVAKFGLAVNRKTKDREETCFIDIVAFGRSAEMCGEYITKGMPLLIEGRLTYNTWEDKDGQKRSKHEVVAENIQFVTTREQNSGSGYSGQSDSGSYKPGEIDEDDIPF